MPAEMDFPPDRNHARDSKPEPAWVSVQRGAYRWDVQPLAYDWLDEHGELPITRWLDEQRATIIKTGPHRTVYHLKLSSGQFYLKHYRTPDWQALLQNLVRPPKADLERQAAQQVAELGLSTFETIAVGRRKRFGFILDNFLISREIEHVHPLDHFVLRIFPKLDPARQRAIRQDIARQLGQMTATLHRSGVLHRDFHPGNLLLQQKDDRRQLFLIDLHATSRKRRLSLPKIAQNFALLNNFFGRLSSKTDRMRFLKSYRQIWNVGQVEKNHLTTEAIRQIDAICRAELAKADLRGDKKWKRGNRRLWILDMPPHHCRGIAGLNKAQLRQIAERPEQLFERPHLIAWQKREPTRNQGLIELEFKGRPVRAIVHSVPRSGSARHAWEMGHALLRRRLPAVRPLLFVETLQDCWDYLVIEEIPEAVSLKHWLRRVSPSFPHHETRPRFRNACKALAVQLRRLHDCGFHQPRLDGSSVLISAEGNQPNICFAGLESLEQVPAVDAPRVVQTLATLLGSALEQAPLRSTECLRFLRSYLGTEFSTAWKTHWQGVWALMRNLSQEEAA